MIRLSRGFGACLNGLATVWPDAAGWIAFEIFRRPWRRSPVLRDETVTMGAAVREEVTVDGVRVAVYRWGGGERPVVLVHGWGSRASRLSALVEPLTERGYTVLSFDAPGHGDSGGKTATILQFRAILQLLQQQYGTFEAVVGYSFGSLASFFAVREGLRTKQLVGMAGVSRLDHLITGYDQQLGLRAELDAQMRRRMADDLLRGEPDVWRRCSATWAPEQVDVPRILLVHDRGDRMAGFGQAEEVAEAYHERVEVFATQGLGHRRIRADPAVVARITEFVRDGAELSSGPEIQPEQS